MKLDCSIFILAFFLSVMLQGQDTVQKASNFVIPHLHYGVGLPGGDLADRFGSHFDLGVGTSVLTQKGLFFGFGFNLLFGSDVKENVLSSLLTTEGGIIGTDMQFASIFLRERGYHAYGRAGFLFKIRDLGKASGILCTGGIGVLSHRIRFVDDFDSIIQLSEPYSRGYDRLSRGVSFHQFLGYLHLSKNRLVNFVAGFEFTQGLTSNVRRYNYDQRSTDTDRRIDLLSTMKIGWLFPIALTREQRYY
ncbi:MAG: hypothetical protein HKN87_10610 [Saprospiraceae bacterium]|nr:hypothetical protein [Saprospiraceae bacterium]